MIWIGLNKQEWSNEHSASGGELHHSTEIPLSGICLQMKAPALGYVRLWGAQVLLGVAGS